MKYGHLLILGILLLGLSACSTQNSSPLSFFNFNGSNTNGNIKEKNGNLSQSAVGGQLAIKMDEADKTKLYHALDNPLGKSTHWENLNSKISYTVTPTKKLTLNGNPFCREYTIFATRDTSSKTITGTACVGADSNWQGVN